MDNEFIRQYCTSLKAVEESIKWENDLVFTIGAKMFCVLSLEPPFRCSFKVADEDFAEWSTRDGFMPAPYMARAKWVSVTRAGSLSRKQWEEAILQSYRLVSAKLSRKIKKELGLE